MDYCNVSLKTITWNLIQFWANLENMISFFFTRFYYVEVVTENHAKGSFDPWLLYQFDVEQSWKLATQNNLGSSLIRNNYPVGKDPLKVSNKEAWTTSFISLIFDFEQVFVLLETLVQKQPFFLNFWKYLRKMSMRRVYLYCWIRKVVSYRNWSPQHTSI